MVEENRRNKKKTIGRTGGTRNLRPGTGGQRRRFNGEEYFTFSLDGLIPAYGDPSQVITEGEMERKIVNTGGLRILCNAVNFRIRLS